MATSGKGTYLYAVVAAGRQPTIHRGLRALAGMGAVRLLDLDRGLWLVVSDAPLDRYGEDAINRGLSNLDWVSRAAVAHEAVVESFVGARAVLPMKLFTIFSSDERAVDFVRQDRRHIDVLLERVANHLEWGVRVVLDRSRAVSKPKTAGKARARAEGGAAYLTKKKAQRDTVLELTARARETAATLYNRLAAGARFARKRTASELPAQSGPLLLDAAFLVSRTRAPAFRALVGRQARLLQGQGYGVTLTGPWPPYTFVQD